MKHGSLFSGIGGFDLAAERVGWKNIFQVEIDPFCQKILKYHFPNTELYEDITKTDFKKYRGSIDIVSGGFPCQPFSLAGKRKGNEDNRFLWTEMLRCIRECNPSWVVAENVYGLLSQGGGMVFEQVCSDLENEGYEVQPIIVPAAGVGAPHKRDRIWFVVNRSNARTEGLQRKRENGIHESEIAADSLGVRDNGKPGDSNGKKKKESIRTELQCDAERSCRERVASHSECCRGRKILKEIKSEQPNGKEFVCNGRKWFIGKRTTWEEFPTQSPVCGGNDGLPDRLDGITFPKWRRESIKAYGNAIVPEMAYSIFKTIERIR
jgi:DNA-methyltransferase (dcm)